MRNYDKHQAVCNYFNILQDINTVFLFTLKYQTLVYRLQKVLYI